LPGTVYRLSGVRGARAARARAYNPRIPAP